MHRQSQAPTATQVAAASTATLPDLVLTLDEAAQLLKCSKGTVKKRVYSGEIPSVKVGALRRVRLSDLQAYVAALPTADASA